ncbi:MAG TPA: IS481 family transposase [Phycisphaerae bacterium]|nr:IS481 family transposase [Phycisphaerae bacterium]
MPWKETCAVEQRMRFVVEWERGEVAVAVLCRQYGISRKTAYKWLKRFDEGSLAALADRRRAPVAHPNRVEPEVERRIIEARMAHPTWGPKKLRVVLERGAPDDRWPACSTIGEILKRRGLVHPRRRRHRTPPYTEPFAAADRPNAVWCADFKGWFRTGDGSRCDPLTVTDAHSRYLLRCQGLRETGFASVQPVFESVFRAHGLPWAIRTDNGAPFASRSVLGLSHLSVWWLKLGIRPERIEAGHPEQNGRHERMHLTLKQETACPPAGTLVGQQRRFDRFVREYNEQRPHEALGMRTPSSRYEGSVRPYPRRVPEWEYPCGMSLRRVYDGGRFRWHCGQVFLSHVLDGELVGLWSLDGRYHQVWLGPLALGILDGQEARMLADREVRKLASEGAIVCPSSFRCAPGARADE